MSKLREIGQTYFTHQYLNKIKNYLFKLWRAFRQHSETIIKYLIVKANMGTGYWLTYSRSGKNSKLTVLSMMPTCVISFLSLAGSIGSALRYSSVFRFVPIDFSLCKPMKELKIDNLTRT